LAKWFHRVKGYFLTQVVSRVWKATLLRTWLGWGGVTTNLVRPGVDPRLFWETVAHETKSVSATKDSKKKDSQQHHGVRKLQYI